MKGKRSATAIAVSLLLLSGCTTKNGLFNRGTDNAVETASNATNDTDKLSRGMYAVIGIGPSRMEPDTSELPAWDVNDRVEPAGQVTLGADISKHLSIEAHSADLGSAGLSPTGRINYHINGASALIYAGGDRDRARRQGLTAFGRVGVGSLDNTAVGDVPFEQTNATHLLIGAGVEYMTPIGVGVRAEGVSFDTDAQYAQLGLMYRTGKNQRTERPKLAEKVKSQPVIAAAKAEPVRTRIVDRCAGLQGALESVNFQSDNAGLTRETIRTLDEVARTLNSCPEVSIEISAHADASGSAQYNESLSKRRATSVIEYLSARGVSKSRLVASAHGEAMPVDSNTTQDGKARNRRVELYAR